MHDRRKNTKRIWFLYFCVTFVAAILIGQLYVLQIMRGQSYRDKAEGQYTIASDPFDRNTVYFSGKDGKLVSAATIETGFILAVNPTVFSAGETSAETAYQKINAILPLDKAVFLEKTAKVSDPYEELAHRVTEGDAEKIKKLDIPGISVFREHWRYYPGGTTASHLLGFVGYEENGRTLSGRYGIERYYDSLLSKDGGVPRMNFFAEVFSSAGTVVNPAEKIKGDVALTIEPTVQAMLLKHITDTKEKFQGAEIGGIVMNPKTGEIYAMESLPGFDPNDIAKENNISVFNDPLVGSTYEMGSVVKPLVMAAGIDSGKITPNSTYNDNLGYVMLDGKKISNYDGKGRGNKIPMQEVLNKSLNTGMVFVMKQMGRKQFAEYMNAYELDDITKIDLPAEVSGNLKNLESKRDVEHATAAFGQGIALTPIGVTRALSALGNGGYLPSPHLLKTTIYPAGIKKDNTTEKGPQVIKPETSEEITRMLVNVVDKALLGGTVKLSNYSIAAKTGTAQISEGGGRGYYEDRFLHSFFGYFPAYDPQFIVFLYLVNPRGVEYASNTLTEPFMQMAKFLLTYYEVPPDR